MMSNIEIFKSQDNKIQLEFSPAQMAVLFGREHSVITKHINNVLKDGELEEISNVQNLHIAKSDKPVNFFSLDIIISICY